MQKALRYLGALTAVPVLLVGSTGSSANAAAGQEGNKARIAVGEITSSADECTSSMTAALGEMLSTALANTGKFVVLADQAALGATGILVSGSVKSFRPEAGGGGLGGLRRRALGAVGVEEKSAELELDLRLIDNSTGRVLESKSLEAKSTNWDADVFAGNWVEDVVLGGALGEYDGEPMEDAIRSALAQAIELINDEVPEEFYRYSGEERVAEGGAAAAAGAAGARQVAEDMTLYTRYDFVPGNKVIFYDDMGNEEEGEFPYRWRLERGVYEVVRLGGEFWIMATDDGYIRPKLPDAPLPPQYTVELEFYDNGPDYSGHYFYIHWVDDQGENIGEFGIVSGESTWLTIQGERLADKRLDARLTKGVHTMRIMATTRSIKCYIDEERAANVPSLENFRPVGFRLRSYPQDLTDNPYLFRGFRFAEGGKTMREQLDEDGKIVTHGILFDSDSYTIKGESYRTLQEIGQLLQDDPALRLSIEGHTDSDGTDEHNMTLSQNRASSVLEYLVSSYGIARDRLEAKGWGESRPIDTNDTAEGKANNRRVELVRL